MALFEKAWIMENRMAAAQGAPASRRYCGDFRRLARYRETINVLLAWRREIEFIALGITSPGEPCLAVEVFAEEGEGAVTHNTVIRQ